jgi:metal-responsive CopG/Arc/MetJ family transcriptional regulator
MLGHVVNVDYYSYHNDYSEGRMRTVQMTLDEELVKAVDQAVKRLGTTRSAFTRNALQEALKKVRSAELDRKHREGYARKPVKHGEFSVWESEQVWGDE